MLLNVWTHTDWIKRFFIEKMRLKFWSAFLSDDIPILLNLFSRLNYFAKQENDFVDIFTLRVRNEKKKIIRKREREKRFLWDIPATEQLLYVPKILNNYILKMHVKIIYYIDFILKTTCYSR